MRAQISPFFQSPLTVIKSPTRRTPPPLLVFQEISSWDPETLAGIGRNAYESVAQADSEAQWLQMGWMFYNDRRHWTPENVEAYLSAVPKGKVTILDYYTEHTPSGLSLKSFTDSLISSAILAISARIHALQDRSGK